MNEIEELVQLAESGNAEAQYELGEEYYKGKKFVRNYDKAFYWLSKAAEQNYAYAQHDLAYMYEKGHGVEKNEEISEKLYIKHVENLCKLGEKGVVKAFEKLGEAYQFGKGVEIDNIRAYMWYTISQYKGLGHNSVSYIEHNMTTEEIRKAQELAQEWIEKGYSKISP